MEELESQVAKIQIGSSKSATSYVQVMAEKAPSGTAELYMVAELPLLNPAAQESCEKISLAIAAALKRSYKRQRDGATFENAVALINDELGKLASLGQTHWVDKLNCIVAAKEGNVLHIATCGKVAAYLYRENKFTDISCSSGQVHPLKTFENLASGKLRLGDLMILSTTQLFNYLAMDRLQKIVSASTFLAASQTILETLKENAGPEISFGTILNLQVQPGETTSEEIDLEEYVAEKPHAARAVLDKAAAFFHSLLLLRQKRKPETALPNLSLPDRLKQAAGNTLNAATGSAGLYRQLSPASAKRHLGTAGSALARWFSAVWHQFDLRNFREFSWQKKFFLISVCVLLLAAVVNIAVAARLAKSRQQQARFISTLTDIRSLLDRAQNALLYRDDSVAKDLLTQADGKLPSFADVPENQTETFRGLEQSITELKSKMDKTVQAEAVSMGNFGQSERLIRLPKYLAVTVGGNLVSYNKENGQFQDGVLKSSEEIIASVHTAGSSAVVYNGASLFVWDFQKGTLGGGFSVNVPQLGDLAGLTWYPTNSRVYTINKKTNQIISYAVGGGSVGKPVVWTKDANDLSNSLDLATDGSMYVLNANGVTKYHGGRLTEFTFPQLFTKFSGQGKIYTEKDFKNIYILDSGNGRIIVLDKKGNLVSTLVSKQFTRLADFQVDEKNKVIWVLNGGSLLKVTLP